jgi:hypothetical protein
MTDETIVETIPAAHGAPVIPDPVTDPVPDAPVVPDPVPVDPKDETIARLATRIEELEQHFRDRGISVY